MGWVKNLKQSITLTAMILSPSCILYKGHQPFNSVWSNIEIMSFLQFPWMSGILSRAQRRLNLEHFGILLSGNDISPETKVIRNIHVVGDLMLSLF